MAHSGPATQPDFQTPSLGFNFSWVLFCSTSVSNCGSQSASLDRPQSSLAPGLVNSEIYSLMGEIGGGVSLKGKIYIQIWAHLSRLKLTFLWMLGSLLHGELALYPGLPSYISPACQKLISQPSLGLSPYPLDQLFLSYGCLVGSN